MNLTERLKLFPGGLQGLAKSAGVATTVVYRFAWKEHKKRPVAVALKISEAIGLVPNLPSTLVELADVEELLDLWSASKPSRVLGPFRAVYPDEEPQPAGGAS